MWGLGGVSRWGGDVGGEMVRSRSLEIEIEAWIEGACGLSAFGIIMANVMTHGDHLSSWQKAKTAKGRSYKKTAD